MALTRDFLSENAASKRHKDLNKRIPDTGLGMVEEKHGCLLGSRHLLRSSPLVDTG